MAIGRRPWKLRNVKVLACCIVTVCLTSIYLAVHVPSPGAEKCNCPKADHGSQRHKDDILNSHRRSRQDLDVGNGDIFPSTNIQMNPDQDHPEWGEHKMAIIVPFRERFEELLDFVPYMAKFLGGKKVRHKIYVINQVDHYRFNRALLINIGFHQSRGECDYIAMHDVDLLPANPALNYSYPATGPYHVAAPDYHPRYHYASFVGGILLLTNEHFERINGMSNRFWGWGREDDEFYVRMKEAKYTIERPANLNTDHTNTFLHIHNKARRPRDFGRYGEQKIAQRTRDRLTGLDTVQYRLVSSKTINVEGGTAQIINVELECDLDDTPWCMSPEQVDQYLKELYKTDEEESNRLRKKLLAIPDGVLVKKVTPDPAFIKRKHEAEKQKEAYLQKMAYR